MMRLLLVLLLSGASLCAAASGEDPPTCECGTTCGCECDSYPFTPDPPCYDCCAAETLAWLSRAELTTILGLDSELAQKVAAAGKSGQIASLQEYRARVGEAGFRELEAALEKAQEEGMDKAVVIAATRSGTLDWHAFMPEGQRLTNIEMGGSLRGVEVSLAVLAGSQRQAFAAMKRSGLTGSSRYREACADFSTALEGLPERDPSTYEEPGQHSGLLPTDLLSELETVDSVCRQWAGKRQPDFEHVDLSGLLARVRALTP